MTGTDIRLTDDWQPAQAADGDALLCSGLDAVYQDISLESVTQPGDLFYDETFGWGLYTFIQSEDDELTRLELITCARQKLQRRDEIDPASIDVTVSHDGDTYRLSCRFRFSEEDTPRALDVVISAVNLEVETID